jgi:hypothetical protein
MYEAAHGLPAEGRVTLRRHYPTQVKSLRRFVAYAREAHRVIDIIIDEGVERLARDLARPLSA